MKVQVNAGHIEGQLAAPPSKSHMQRVVAAAILSNGTTIITRPGYSNDCKSALGIAKQLGALVKTQDDLLEITGKQHPIKTHLDCGEAGLGIRMFSSIAALQTKEITLSGRGSLLSRPMHFFENTLPHFSVSCQSNDGKLPIKVKGPMQAGTAEVDGRLSSQYLSGLLMALPLAGGDSILHVKDLKSKPYIDLTIDVLKDFGVSIDHYNYKTFHIKGQQNYSARKIEIEGDWSSASFPLVAAAIGGQIKMTHLNTKSKQADRHILKAIDLAGAKLVVEKDTIHISHQDLNAFEFDATDCPDLFPPLLILASQCAGITKIKGVTRLYHKESNRALVLRDEFSKLGIKIRLDNDWMFVEGNSILNDATIDAHNDHRIAMAASIIAAAGNINVKIKDAESVAKSYPNFYDDMKKIGCQITVLQN